MSQHVFATYCDVSTRVYNALMVLPQTRGFASGHSHRVGDPVKIRYGACLDGCLEFGGVFGWLDGGLEGC
jgi:hypothetical protein